MSEPEVDVASLSALRERARDVADAHAETGRVEDGAVPNVAVGVDDENPATRALYAAVLRVFDGDGDGGDSRACLHAPDPDATAAGPWFVLEPLAGRLSTVHAGRGRVDVAFDPDADVHETLSNLVDAARPEHEHYPVADDGGVFTTGMEVAELRRFDADGDPPAATFDVRVTPTTRRDRVESRFRDVAGIAGADFDVVAGVERAAPSERLRGAVERAHAAVRGDCEYEWWPEPTAFSHLPTSEKVAFGAVSPGADDVETESLAATAELLERTLSAWHARKGREGER